MQVKAKVRVTRIEIALVEIDDNGDPVGVNETLDEVEQVAVEIIEKMS